MYSWGDDVGRNLSPWTRAETTSSSQLGAPKHIHVAQAMQSGCRSLSVPSVGHIQAAATEFSDRKGEESEGENECVFYIYINMTKVLPTVTQ